MSGSAAPRRPARVLLVGVSVRAVAESAARAGFEVVALDAFGDLDLRARAADARALPRELGVPYGSLAAARAARAVACDAVAYVAGFENSPRAVSLLGEGRALWGNPPAVLRSGVRDPVRLARALAARGFTVPVTEAGAGAVRRAAAAAVRLTAEADEVAAGAAAASAGGVPGGPPRDQDSAERGEGRHRSIARRSDSSREAPPAERDYTRDGRERHHSSARRIATLRAAGGHTAWLAKRRRSGGGHGVRVWAPGDRLARGWVLQERVAGVPGSVSFIADGRGNAVPIGVSRQLVGERELGAAGFTYCGSVLAPANDPHFGDDALLVARAAALAAAVAEAFGLVGACGVDFIARGGVPVPIEVNPRYSASMELVERAYGLPVFAAHAAACTAGALPAFDLVRARRSGAGAVGKAIVYARRDVVLGDTTRWLDDDSVRDVPHPGERIRAGRPICTVFARGDDAAGCRAALLRRAEGVYEEVECTRRRTA